MTLAAGMFGVVCGYVWFLDVGGLAHADAALRAIWGADPAIHASGWDLCSCCRKRISAHHHRLTGSDSRSSACARPDPRRDGCSTITPPPAPRGPSLFRAGRLVHVQRGFRAVPAGQRRARRSGPGRVDPARASHVGDAVGACDASGGLADSGVEAAVTRAPARTFTDKEDVVATDRVIPVDCVTRPRVVARRPDEEQRSFGHFSTTRSSPGCTWCQGCTPANHALAGDVAAPRRKRPRQRRGGRAARPIGPRLRPVRARHGASRRQSRRALRPSAQQTRSAAGSRPRVAD